MEPETTTNPEERFGVEKWSRGGGQPKPRPAGGPPKQWQPPTGGTTPADRKKLKADRKRQDANWDA